MDRVDEPPFPPHLEGVFNGTAPAALQVIEHGDVTRFQITSPARQVAIVDLSRGEVAALIRRLTGGRP
jgi:hypothetical protein